MQLCTWCGERCGAEKKIHGCILPETRSVWGSFSTRANEETNASYCDGQVDIYRRLYVAFLQVSRFMRESSPTGKESNFIIFGCRRTEQKSKCTKIVHLLVSCWIVLLLHFSFSVRTKCACLSDTHFPSYKETQ